MVVRSSLRALAVEQVGDVTSATFTVRSILDQDTANLVGNQLLSLVRDEGCKRVLINFVNLERLATYLVGKIVAVHQLAESTGGRVVLCRINPAVAEIFKILKLTRILHIYDDEQDALQSF